MGKVTGCRTLPLLLLQEEAMRTRKVTEITVETRQVTIIRRHPAVRAWCHDCAAFVEMVTAEQAAVLTGQSVRAIYRQVELGRYFNETTAGMIRLCHNSVVRAADSTAGAAPQAGPPGQTF